MSHLDSKRGSRLLLQCLVVCLAAFAQTARAQQTQQTPSARQTPQQDEVVRVETELVNTDVTVFDKSGKFVEGLGREQFQVMVDGKPVPVSFFENVAGAPAVAAPPTRAPGSNGATAPTSSVARARVRGRYVAFFLDDIHLSAASLDRVRKTIALFLDRGMGPDDRVMIATATGQLGFLQQFIDNRGVLKFALTRVVYKPFIVRDNAANIGMTEYQALRIDAGDRDALSQYVDLMMSQTNARKTPVGVGPPGGGSIYSTPSKGLEVGVTREQAERSVRERAQLLLKETSSYSMGTLTALEGLMRGTSQFPGRKLVFFVSDGFYLNDKNTDFSDRLRGIADAALRAGVVIYTIDARGLNTGDTDASSNRSDPLGRLSRANTGDLASSQAPLTSLASDTGGRAQLNSFAFDEAVTRALTETSNYYRVAWKPETDEQKGGKFKRVEVSVVGRPDLTVRLPRGYMASLAATSKPAAKTEPKPADPSKPAEALSPEAKAANEDFNAALGSAAPLRALPTVLSTSFVDVPGSGVVLTSGVEVSTDALDYGAEGKQPAAVDIIGFIWNEQGKRAGEFKTRLNVSPMAPASVPAGGEQPGVIYNARTPLSPGFYLVKVAARDARGRQMGTAAQWVEMPDLSKHQLALSSLHLGGRTVGGDKPTGPGSPAPQVQFSVDRRFARSSKLDFLAFIYNAARAGGAGAVDLSANVRITRDGRAVVAAPPIKIAPPAQADLARIPFTGVISLGQLPPGRYELELEINDNSAKATAAQRIAFDVE
jgi:VWFA-related protein